ncbi:hypothetical protein B0H17DRAFT_1180984 [Mycena rosella]|uniref:Uncharacterized protein n=1 Tax=Mycena rosella TaxID=1033263 RepID=A0AAD7GBN6_MYCRO|nr:hypothetical protein B0H17DRAFT_1180984 [Mycena rosella]
MPMSGHGSSPIAENHVTRAARRRCCKGTCLKTTSRLPRRSLPPSWGILGLLHSALQDSLCVMPSTSWLTQGNQVVNSYFKAFKFCFYGVDSRLGHPPGPCSVSWIWARRQVRTPFWFVSGPHACRNPGRYTVVALAGALLQRFAAQGTVDMRWIGRGGLVEVDW